MTGGRLAHAIARSRGADAPSGIGGFSRLEADGLAIVHGPAPPHASTPDTAVIEAYASAIDGLHRLETVLPLRYGCIAGSEPELAAILRRHRDAWLAALDEVEGCDEIGLRVLLHAPARPDRPPRGPTPATTDRPGTAYLAALQARLAGADALSDVASRASEMILEALGGLCRRSTVERPGPGRDRLLSMSFLVPRAGLDAFRLAARGLEGQAPGKLLLTGPWPPYNFAGPGPGAEAQT